MKKYLVSTITYEDMREIARWDGDWIEATSPQDAVLRQMAHDMLSYMPGEFNVIRDTVEWHDPNYGTDMMIEYYVADEDGEIVL